MVKKKATITICATFYKYVLQILSVLQLVYRYKSISNINGI